MRQPAAQERCPATAGDSSFAEDPVRAAPDATIIWHAAFDPSTLRIKAEPASGADPDAIAPESLTRWLRIVRDAAGDEHAVLSDGRHRIRLDVLAGTLTAGPVLLRYDLTGLPRLGPELLGLQRLIALYCRHRFPIRLFPVERRVERWLVALRVRDALADGASQRDIAAALFGRDAAQGWRDGSSDSVRSRVRRLVREASHLAKGGFWKIMSDRRQSPRIVPDGR